MRPVSDRLAALAVILPLLSPLVSAAVEPTATERFQGCLQDLREQARAAGIRPPTIAAALDDVEPLQRVVLADRNQAEFTRTFADYLNTRVTSGRVETGRSLLDTHRQLLQAVTMEHGVPPQYLMAFWGLETNFGGYLGKQPTFAALVTLACDERRAAFFGGQVMDALRVVESDRLDPRDMVGSWAGAMGHMQFMPSTWRAHAIDGDGDGRRDLWRSLPDAMHSAGRFLASMGWQPGWRWGREVILPADFDYALAGLDGGRSLAEWRELGVLRTDRQPLPALDVRAAVIVPMGHRGPAFVVYRNFEVIMGWNRSVHYALTVGHLADRINGAGGFARPLPDDPPLPTEAVERMQAGLNALGYDAGSVDGVVGSATQRALAAFQQDRELVADGYPTAAMVEQVTHAVRAKQGAVENAPGAAGEQGAK